MVKKKTAQMFLQAIITSIELKIYSYQSFSPLFWQLRLFLNNYVDTTKCFHFKDNPVQIFHAKV